MIDYALHLGFKAAFEEAMRRRWLGLPPLTQEEHDAYFEAARFDVLARLAAE